MKNRMILIAMCLLVFSASVRIYAQDTLSHSVDYDTTYSDGKISLQKIVTIKTKFESFSAPTGLAYVHVADAVRAFYYPDSIMEVHSYKLNDYFHIEDFVSYYSYDKNKDTWICSPDKFIGSGNTFYVFLGIVVFVIFIIIPTCTSKFYKILTGLLITFLSLGIFWMILESNSGLYSVGYHAEMSLFQKFIFVLVGIISTLIFNFFSSRFEKNK